MVEFGGAVTVFGLSTEGYRLASSLVRQGVQTTIIDENLKMALDLKPEVAATHPSVGQLMEEEGLLGLKPLDSAISEAKVIFFTPKVRRAGEDMKSEVNLRIKEVAKYLQKEAVFVNGVPGGIGSNHEIVALVEKVSGLKDSEDFEYIYCPLKPGETTPITIGTIKPKLSEDLRKLFKLSGINALHPLPIAVSELSHARQTVSQFIDVASELELLRKITPSSERLKLKKIPHYHEVYLNDLTEYLFDLKILSASFEPGEPFLYLTTGILKSVEGYMKYLFDEVRRLIRERGLKTGRTKVTLAWSMDRFEIRGDRLTALVTLKDKLQDLLGDVETVMDSQKGFPAPMEPSGRTITLIACSQQDYEASVRVRKSMQSMAGAIIIKANLLCEVTS